MDDSESDDGAKRRDREATGDAAADGASGKASSLLEGILRRAGRVAGGTLDLALDVATSSALAGDNRLRDLLASTASPERLEAMAEAGHFLRDARETAGLSLAELSERLDIGDEDVLRGVEEGRTILPLDIMLRAASLLARHDPIPFLIRFLRSYNPGIEATLEQWGVMALPKNYERERRFINLYRQHDFLRDLSDEEHQRFIEYMGASTNLVVQMMQREAEAAPRRSARKRRSAKAPGSARGSRRGKSTRSTHRSASAGAGTSAARPESASKRRASGAARTRPAKPASQTGEPTARPVVRKVKPRKP